MRTLILSDLHLGNGGDYDIFAGNDALPALLDRFVHPPTQVILNGDSMDFLLNDEPLKLDASRAVGQAESIATARSTKPTLEALGRICAAEGEVVVRMGNHDAELALEDVRDVFRKHLSQPVSVARKMIFERGNTPHIMNVGGATILITHGEQDDPFNQVDYNHLPGDVSFGLLPDILTGLSLKLTRAGLKLYAHIHRLIADESGKKYFSYEPAKSEMDEARRLSKKYNVKAVITGHSHAARWKQDSSFLYANTGTWIWLMRLTDEKASDDEWTDFLNDLRDDPKLLTPKNQSRMEKHFTPVTVEPRKKGGATVTLHTWEPATGMLHNVYSAILNS